MQSKALKLICLYSLH